MEVKTLWNSFNAVIVAAGGWLGWYVGGWDGFLYALVVFVAMDYLTGIMCATADKNLSSEIGAKGIFKKVFIFALVGVAHTIDTYLISGGGAVRTAVIFFFINNEGISMLENAARLGLPIPPNLKNILKELRASGQESGGRQG